MTAVLERNEVPALAPDAPAPVTVRELTVCDPGPAGTHTLTWAPGTDVEQEARQTFADRKARGYFAYTTAAAPEEHEIVHEFDPTARVQTMCPAIQGG